MTTPTPEEPQPQVNLLDGNVLVALVVATHEHHGVATAWFDRGDAFATCPITQGTVLRMLIRLGHSAPAAAEILARLTSGSRHCFWPDDLHYTSSVIRGVQGHRQVTDAYLADLARHRSGRLVTLDRGLAATHPDIADLVSA